MLKLNDCPKFYYSEIRDWIETGDALLFSGNSFVSKLIKIATANPISHTGMAVRKDGSIFCIESTTLENGRDGVRMSTLRSRLLSTNGRVFLRNLGDDRHCNIHRTQEFGLKLQRAFEPFYNDFKDKLYEKHILELLGACMPWRNKNDLKYIFCSEMYAAFLMGYAEILPCCMPANEYTPADFTPGGWAEKLLIKPAYFSPMIELVR